MTIPFWSLLTPYGAYLALFAVLALLDVSHMVRFGTFGFVNFLALFMFLAGTAFILWATMKLLAPVDWMLPITWSVNAGTFSETPNCC